MVTAMRRTVAILALLVPLLRVAPAAAHVCSAPVEADVGEPVTVTVGLSVEATAVRTVEVGVPAGFRVTEAGGRGWQADVQRDVVRFEGDTLAPFTCGYVTVEGVAERRARFAFPLTLVTVDGERVAYDADEPYREDSAQFVYAGLDPPDPPGTGGGGSDPLKVVSTVLLGVGAVLAVALVVAWLRSRRNGGP